MNTLNPRLIFSSLLASVAVLCCAAKAPEPATVVSLGNNTYSITRKAKTAFTRDAEEMEQQVQADAAAYCAKQGKQLKVVSVSHDKPWIGFGYVSAKITFKALDAAELAASEAPVPPDPVAAMAHPSPTGDMYSDLLKLDDLHKKGILTDDEFKSEKQKVLDRSH